MVAAAAAAMVDKIPRQRAQCGRVATPTLPLEVENKQTSGTAHTNMQARSATLQRPTSLNVYYGSCIDAVIDAEDVYITVGWG